MMTRRKDRFSAKEGNLPFKGRVVAKSEKSLPESSRHSIWAILKAAPTPPPGPIGGDTPAQRFREGS